MYEILSTKKHDEILAVRVSRYKSTIMFMCGFYVIQMIPNYFEETEDES